MIGFNLEAYSNPGEFKASRSSWTEGSLWILKKVIDNSGNKVANVGAHNALIDAIEGKFEKMKELRFDEVATSGMDYHLMVSIADGSSFTCHFENKKTSEVIRFELAQKIANMKEGIGDQVALAMFETIIDFQAYFVSNELWKYDHNFLHIQIDL